MCQRRKIDKCIQRSGAMNEKPRGTFGETSLDHREHVIGALNVIADPKRPAPLIEALARRVAADGHRINGLTVLQNDVASVTPIGFELVQRESVPFLREESLERLSVSDARLIFAILYVRIDRRRHVECTEVQQDLRSRERFSQGNKVCVAADTFPSQMAIKFIATPARQREWMAKRRRWNEFVPSNRRNLGPPL
mmetsp:Transcript_31685/g.97980  ORF Transcript_31685/g.97980 Transcript_31685/m.97980 type:complete len:195 (+) Transcript_31685:31-615(+)